MKKSKLICWLFSCALLFQSELIKAQDCINVLPPSPNASAVYESKNGWVLPCSGTLRVLFILAEINYDVGTDPNSWVTWQQGTFPSWGNSFIDPNLPTGLLTQYYSQASSGNYTVLGDFLAPTSNNGIISVNRSDMLAQGNLSALVNAINAQMPGGFVAKSGITNKSLFDLWTPTATGSPKINSGNNSFDHVMIIWRNSSIPNGTGHGNIASFGNILGFNSDTYTEVGAQVGMPLEVARHEYAHFILGSNNFHVSGGKEVNMWIGQIAAHSLLSLTGAALSCWSAWDRQRLDWKTPTNQFAISARDAGNTSEVSGDLNTLVASQAGIYTLRDFVTTGDALRIRLPFTSSNKYQEYIWLENHNGQTLNGNIFDEYRNGVGNTCITPAPFGLYTYLQIGKDINSEINGASNLYGSNSDYVRYISADGFYDETLDNSTVTSSCWPPAIRPFVKTAPNPLTGICDLDDIPIDLLPPAVTLDFNDKYPHIYEDVAGLINYNVFQAGNSRQVFTISGNKKLGVGYNPSCSSMINLSGYTVPAHDPQDERIIYLNGLSIEILNQNAGVIQVKIRFDDVDVVNDLKWCAPEIDLNQINTTTGYSLNITTGHHVTLDQGLTPTKMDNPISYNGQTIFTDPTVMRCKTNSFLNLDPNSELIVDNNTSCEGFSIPHFLPADFQSAVDSLDFPIITRRL